MKRALLITIAWAACAAGLVLAQDQPEVLPPPTAPPTPAAPLELLPPFPGPGPVLTPVPSAPQLPPPKPMGGFSIKKEYLCWWIRDPGMPGPLVTTGTAASAGVLGVPGTVAIFGNGGLDLDKYNGFRDTCTFWLDGDEKLGVQVSGFLLEQRTEPFEARSDANGSPVLARPVIDALTGRETVSLVSYPGAFTGGIGASLTNRLWGFEGNVTGKFSVGANTDRFAGRDPVRDAAMRPPQMLKLGWLAGVRYLRFDERLGVFQIPTLDEDGVAGFFGHFLLAGDTLMIEDSFSARSQFWGPQVGGLAELKLGPAVVTGSFKLAMGNSHEVVSVWGSTGVVIPGQPPQAGPGGLLAVGSNSGRHSTDVFAVVPELGLSVGVQPMRNVRAAVGYNFLYWSSVVRATDQVNRIVNPTQVPSSLQYAPLRGPAQPQLPFDQTDFWAQGLTFSLELLF